MRSAADVFKAELLKADQHTIELAATRKGYLDMLEKRLFLNKPITGDSVLVKPVYGFHSQEIKQARIKTI